jgi:RNA polymerase sigma factor (sigma-70 family)
VTANTAMPVAWQAPTDATLIRLSLHDGEQFASLFDRHAAEIFRYAAGRLGPDAADDVTAQTFLTAFRKRDSYDLGRDDARPWLYGIASRWISEHRRVERRHYERLARVPVVRSAEPFEDAAADRVFAQQMRPRLAAVLAALAADERDLLLLAAWTDLSYAEIADALGIAPGTVASRLHRVRVKVRQLLDKHNQPSPREESQENQHG